MKRMLLSLRTTFSKVLFIALMIISSGNIISQELVSPDGNINLNFELDENGQPQYQISYKNQAVLEWSKLGFELSDGKLSENLKIQTSSKSSVDSLWSPVWGEESIIKNSYNELLVELVSSEDKRNINIRFRLFDDGLGFRYEFPVQPHLKHFSVIEELTEFNLTGNHKAFWTPADFDSNEYTYITSKLSEIDAWKEPIISYGNNENNRPDQFGVKTPLLLKTSEDLYINIHEAALINYPAMQLHMDKENMNLISRLTPDVLGNKAYLRTPFRTPWRTLIISDKAEDILASRLILNLNEPSKIEDESWIKPMKYMGVWWELQTGKSNWNYTHDLDKLDEEGNLIPHGRHAATTDNVKDYIDFASRHNIEGLLVEGWNIGWEEWLSGQEENFDFITPYPDFDLEEITQYAKEKSVKLIMHHETGASASNYDRKMDTAFAFMNHYDYPAVKTGYVGAIQPRGEHHDGQWMVNHFNRSIKKAADKQIMMNIHEAVRPTGTHRTWPNYLASESARGNEWNAFSTGSPPEHETILPFTRLVGGPMDYTSGIFNMQGYAAEDPDRQMHSTLVKQLALYVVIYSPLQMAADLPENYEKYLDAFQFIKDVPVDWDKTNILDAEPGDYILTARKTKDSETWFVGGITDENAREIEIDFDFLPENKKYTATIYEDGSEAHWKTNPESYTIREISIDSNSSIKQGLAPGGGVAISIKVKNE